MAKTEFLFSAPTGSNCTFHFSLLDLKYKLDIFSSSFIWLKQNIFFALLLGVIVLSTFHFSKTLYSLFWSKFLGVEGASDEGASKPERSGGLRVL